MRGLLYKHIDGHPDQVLSDLTRVISEHTRRDRAARYKIGITSKPERRHKHKWYSRYHEMIVVYRSDRRDHVESLERYFIDYFWEEKSLANERAGGAGRKGPPPYFLYIVVRQPNQTWLAIRRFFARLFG